MSETVNYRVVGDVAVLAVAHPPVNALSHSVRSGLLAGLERATADPGVRAIVLAAEGKTFPAGADISEFGTVAQPPSLPELCAQIEASEKPVIAALHGTPRGGGLELALAAHARIADVKTTMGLPEVRLGLVPGSGGTQRTPRLIGPKAALDMMLSGDPVPAPVAHRVGLIDAVVSDDLTGAAMAMARGCADKGARPLAIKSDRHLKDGAAWMAEIARRREMLKGTIAEAPARIVDCVEATILMPADAALRFERAAFEDLLGGDQSDALRHVFFAERRASKLPELKGITPRPVAKIGVIGAGLMGAGITVAALDAGLSVVLVERDIEALEAGAERVIDVYDRAIEKKRITPELRDKRMSQLSGHSDISAVKDCDLIIEAVVEDLHVKKDVFARLGRVAKEGAILATNTSYLDINDIAQVSGRAADVIGLHFFSPAHVMALLEIIPGDATTPDVVATGFALAQRLRKIGVRAGVTDGFIGNRVFAAYRQAAEYLLEDGASVQEIDAAMRAFGFPLGPFEVSDLAGLEIAWARRQRLAATRDPLARYVSIPDRLCELGRLGRKVGRGWYNYPRGSRRGEVDPEVTALVAEERVFHGIKPHKFSIEDIQRTCFLAMVNEGAKLLDEGIARTSSDIDVVLIHGYAFPRWRGGPMKAADQAGLLPILKDLERLARDEPSFWTPSPRFAELIKNGETFSAAGA